MSDDEYEYDDEEVIVPPPKEDIVVEFDSISLSCGHYSPRNTIFDNPTTFSYVKSGHKIVTKVPMMNDVATCHECGIALPITDLVNMFDRYEYLIYGSTIDINRVLFETVCDITKIWSPDNVAGLSKKLTSNSDPTGSANAYALITNMITYHKENPTDDMGDKLVDMVLTASGQLTEKEESSLLSIIEKMVEKKKVTVKSGPVVAVKGDSNCGIKGIGYSGDANESAYKDKKEEKDDELISLLKRLISVLTKEGVVNASTEPFFRKDWSVVDMVSSYLRAGSVEYVEQHVQLYREIMNILGLFSVDNVLVPLLVSGVGLSTKKSLIELLSDFLNVLTSVDTFTVLVTQVRNIITEAGDTSTLNKYMFEMDTEAKGSKYDYDTIISKFIPIVDLNRKPIQVITAYQTERCYVETMKDKLFSTINFAAVASTYKHSFLDKPSTPMTPARMKRVREEITKLKSQIEVTYSSTIFTLIDDTRYDLMSFMITGPHGTPYSNGCFVFDLYLPPEFPEACPKMLFKTTDGGRVRFNPNLYNCGKVCLSLLGTWSGPGWGSHSSIYQVVMSIQSLILTTLPFYNEPGHTINKGASDAYNATQRTNTARVAILGMMSAPDPIFSEVIKLHFSIKRVEIVNQLLEWKYDITPHLTLLNRV